MSPPPVASFAPDSSQTIAAERGQSAHRDHVEQSRRSAAGPQSPRPGVWFLTGNGLSNPR